MFCPRCNSDILSNHTLEARDIPLMANQSKILQPACSVCGHIIQRVDVLWNIRSDRKVLLITGTAGSGKTSIGQMIEHRTGYIFVDGDAIQKRVNFFAKKNPNMKVDYQAETIDTAVILCGLGYHVVVGYIINIETLKMYTEELKNHLINPTFRVLVPERSVCLERDFKRECWTAGEKWVDAWYDEMRGFLLTHPAACLDTSNETLEETFHKHFEKLLC